MDMYTRKKTGLHLPSPSCCRVVALESVQPALHCTPQTSTPPSSVNFTLVFSIAIVVLYSG